MYNFFKRLFDIIFSIVGISLFLPLIFMIYLFSLIRYNSNPFFLKKRTKNLSENFYIIKFKSMTDLPIDNKNKVSDDERLDAYGKFLRNSSLDEIPQLINVLKGDMSFVGPRPLLPEYLALYNKTQLKRFKVRPGITGWAQINGRNNLSWKKKFEYDIWYVDNINFLLDLKIILSTFLVVLFRKNINSKKNQIVEKFNGKN